ncbi:hypothetical protein A9Z40_03140 [Microbacterium arborescens]|uniref:Tail assembly chaperone n=1 Tax=Microbacterium arborescens TaxID=33883 RepID=A0ABX2WIA4_9MICO|nr:hypothetical protein [Microbacterium arborescens]OAZ40950.1 hypothetical protein A9Z40_03140 [Microbacterium arborescens]
MGYTIPDWKKSIDQDKFPVTTEDGVYNLPKAEYLTGRQAQLLQEADEVEGGIWAVLDEITPGLGTALLDVPVKYVKEMVEAWQDDSGISLGESEASAS